MSECKECDLRLLENRIKNMDSGLQGMNDGEEITVHKAMLASCRDYMVELLDLRRRSALSTMPLMLDELWQMDGDPVWVSLKDGAYGKWGIIAIGTSTGMLKAVCLNAAYDECDYVKTWLAYRANPEDLHHDK